MREVSVFRLPTGSTPYATVLFALWPGQLFAGERNLSGEAHSPEMAMGEVNHHHNFCLRSWYSRSVPAGCLKGRCAKKGMISTLLRSGPEYRFAAHLGGAAFYCSNALILW